MTKVASSITLCDADTSRNAYLQEVLAVALEHFESSKLFSNATVILTGSLARGEASVLQDELGFRSLSDMEFLVSTKLNLPVAQYVKDLRFLQREANQAVIASGKKCNIEYTFALEKFFLSAKPSIFVYELKKHGKVVQGPESPLAVLKDYSSEEIPKLDAFYLVCNRMIEQLDVLDQFYSHKISEEAFRYAILKFYVDIATSVLVIEDAYSATYSSRCNTFESLLPSNPGPISCLLRLREKVRFWTSIKLHPSVEALRYAPGENPFDEWLELGRMVLEVWDWELRYLFSDVSTDDTGRRLNLATWGNYSVKVRENLKYLIRATKSDAAIDFSLNSFFRHPRHVLYLHASDLYRRICDQSSSANEPEAILLNVSKDIRRLHHLWTVCFRNG